MGSVRTLIIGRPRPLPADRPAAPYTLICDEPPSRSPRAQGGPSLPRPTDPAHRPRPAHRPATAAADRAVRGRGPSPALRVPLGGDPALAADPSLLLDLVENEVCWRLRRGDDVYVVRGSAVTFGLEVGRPAVDSHASRLAEANLYALAAAVRLLDGAVVAVGQVVEPLVARASPCAVLLG